MLISKNSYINCLISGMGEVNQAGKLSFPNVFGDGTSSFQAGKLRPHRLLLNTGNFGILV